MLEQQSALMLNLDITILWHLPYSFISISKTAASYSLNKYRLKNIIINTNTIKLFFIIIINVIFTILREVLLF